MTHVFASGYVLSTRDLLTGVQFIEITALFELETVSTRTDFI